MLDEKHNQSTLNYAVISFPSDRLTFGAIRKAYPNLFDVDVESNSKTFFDQPWMTPDLDSMFYLERLLARQAYEIANGQSEETLRNRYQNNRDNVDRLGSIYLRFGLVTGQQQTEQLVREFQAHAVAQAPGRLSRA